MFRRRRSSSSSGVERSRSRFRIERELGRGGMGIVYPANDETMDREVALKIIARKHADDAELIERLPAGRPRTGSDGVRPSRGRVEYRLRPAGTIPGSVVRLLSPSACL